MLDNFVKFPKLLSHVIHKYESILFISKIHFAILILNVILMGHYSYYEMSKCFVVHQPQSILGSSDLSCILFNMLNYTCFKYSVHFWTTRALKVVLYMFYLINSI